MPIVDVTYASETHLPRLVAALPEAGSLAVTCPEEPYDGDLRPGDVEIRCRSRVPTT